MYGLENTFPRVNSRIKSGAILQVKVVCSIEHDIKKRLVEESDGARSAETKKNVKKICSHHEQMSVIQILACQN